MFVDSTNSPRNSPVPKDHLICAEFFLQNLLKFTAKKLSASSEAVCSTLGGPKAYIQDKTTISEERLFLFHHYIETSAALLNSCVLVICTTHSIKSLCKLFV